MNIGTSFDWYRLSFVKGLGPKSSVILYNSLATNNISIEEIFYMNEVEFSKSFPEFGKGRFSRIKLSSFKDVDYSSVERSYQDLLDNDVKIIGLSTKGYSTILKKNLKYESPSLIYLKGNNKLFSGLNNISIVGSRKSSQKLLDFTVDIASELSKHSYNVISGYAKGVDSAAHFGALSSEGNTIAVLPQGILTFSIKNDLKKYIDSRNTAFISQFKPNEGWKGRNAMQRNKIVIGLSQYVIIMESGPSKDSKGRMSGTYDAAMQAKKMGIPVLVLDYNSKLVNSSGNEDLIRMGALSFSSLEDLLNIINSNGKSFVNNSNQLSIDFE